MTHNDTTHNDTTRTATTRAARATSAADEYIARAVRHAARSLRALDEDKVLTDELCQRGYTQEAAFDLRIISMVMHVAVALILDELRTADPGRADEVAERLTFFQDTGDGHDELVHEWSSRLDAHPAAAAPAWVLRSRWSAADGC